MQQLKYFLAVCEEMNITKASKKVHLSQQAMSMQMMKLEQKYMVPLFIRDSNGRLLGLTEQGQKLKGIATGIVESETEFIESCLEYNNKLKVNLSLGLTQSAAKLLVPEIVPLFVKAFPKVSLNIVTDLFELQKENLKNGKIDMLLSFADEDLMSNYSYDRVATEQLYMVMSEKTFKENYNASTGESFTTFISPIDISKLEPTSYFYPQEGTYTHECVERLLNKKKTNSRVSASASGEMLIQMAKSGMGSTFVMSIALGNSMDIIASCDESNRLCAFPLLGEATHCDMLLYRNERIAKSEANVVLSYNITKVYQEVRERVNRSFAEAAYDVIFN